MKRIIIGIVLSVSFIAASLSAAVPFEMSYQGYLTDGSGNPVADDWYTVQFRIYDGPSSGASQLWSSGPVSVYTTNGRFEYLIGSGVSPLSPFDFWDENRYLGLTVGTDPEISPRTKLVTSPYSFSSFYSELAESAYKLGSQSPSYYLDWANMTNVPTDIADGDDVDTDWNHLTNVPADIADGDDVDNNWNNLYNVPAGFADNIDNVGSGDITAVTAGTGLSGGGSTGSVTLNLSSNISSSHTFNGGTFRLGDSTFKADNNGILIGSNTSTSSSYLLYINRHYSTGSARYGIFSTLNNTGAGSVYGYRTWIRNPGTGNRYGLSTLIEGEPTSMTSGVSYGIHSVAYDGAVAYGIYASGSSANTNYAGYFAGNVSVSGSLSKGGGSFKIDHPLDPENKYLQHSFVESPDMMNIYNGNITTDQNGYATVTMPDYFDALNTDFRYQLTVIRTFAQAIIAQKVENRQFVIQTDQPNVEVSWQVTGIRQDPWAQTNRIEVEVEKPIDERGTYLHSKAYGQPFERDTNYKHVKEKYDQRKAEGLED